MRLVVLTLEFSCGTFSGNGIYCRSQARGIAHRTTPHPHQVRALAALGHDLLVVAGRPHDAPDADSAPTEGAKQLLQVLHKRGNLYPPHRTHQVPLPVWNRLDAQSSWQVFADACSQPHIVQAVAAFGYAPSAAHCAPAHAARHAQAVICAGHRLVLTRALQGPRGSAACTGQSICTTLCLHELPVRVAFNTPTGAHVLLALLCSLRSCACLCARNRAQGV